jgi:hypothetical protein
MIAPTIHNNGTDGEVLQAQAQASYEAGRALLQALRDGAPNARDYYPQGDTVYRLVATKHLFRAKLVEDLCDALAQELLAIRNQRGT